MHPNPSRAFAARDNNATLFHSFTLQKRACSCMRSASDFRYNTPLRAKSVRFFVRASICIRGVASASGAKTDLSHLVDVEELGQERDGLGVTVFHLRCVSPSHAIFNDTIIDRVIDGFDDKRGKGAGTDTRHGMDNRSSSNESSKKTAAATHWHAKRKSRVFTHEIKNKIKKTSRPKWEKQNQVSGEEHGLHGRP